MNLGSSELLIIIFIVALLVGAVAAPIWVVVNRTQQTSKPPEVWVSPSPGAPPVKVPADGWYPDPHARHELRWFSAGRWTDQVSDAGVPGTDPI